MKSQQINNLNSLKDRTAGVPERMESLLLRKKHNQIYNKVHGIFHGHKPRFQSQKVIQFLFSFVLSKHKTFHPLR